MQLNSDLTPLTKINSKWIQELNIRVGNTKLLQESIVGSLLDIDLGNILLDMAPKAQETEANLVRLH